MKPQSTSRMLCSLLLWLAAALCQGLAWAQADGRLALVVGNSSYPGAPLANPRNDAVAMSALLSKAGFQVDRQLDTSMEQLQAAVTRFGKAIKDPKVKLGLFYYAGHGLQLDWRNYLVPVSANIQSAADVPKQTVDVSSLLNYMEQAQGRSFLVILDACRQGQEWRRNGMAPLRVAVNASAQQMRGGRLLQAVERALTETGLPPDLLEIEITESMLQNEEECIQTLHALKRLGVALAIDDFGTGYSCLSSLKSLPIQRLKIDQAFTRGIPEDPNDAAIAETIIAIAHRLRLDVIAEGVETESQKAFLDAHGCEGAQGFLYARPMPAAAVAGFIQGQTGGG